MKVLTRFLNYFCFISHSTGKQHLRKKNENFLKKFFNAGMTPDWGQSSEDTEVLKGVLASLCMSAL